MTPWGEPAGLPAPVLGIGQPGRVQLPVLSHDSSRRSVELQDQQRGPTLAAPCQLHLVVGRHHAWHGHHPRDHDTVLAAHFVSDALAARLSRYLPGCVTALKSNFPLPSW
jgi:hypothetical protein